MPKRVKVSPTGLYQYLGFDRSLCVDCIAEALEANMNMERSDWVPADIGDFDAEHCDSCDCVPAAEGKVLA
jgi:hypothetical protein